MNATTTMGNKVKFVSIAVAAALVGALGLGGAATAFADGEQVDAGSYSYLKGQMEVSDRMADVTDEDTDGNTDSDGNAYAEGAEYSYKAGAERGASYADADSVASRLIPWGTTCTWTAVRSTSRPRSTTCCSTWPKAAVSC